MSSDLKTENILLDYEGHICLTDFGLCKEDLGFGEKTKTFCGTPEYLAPEILQGHEYGPEVDWWSLGTLIYEMFNGLPPFYAEDVPVMYNRILQDPLEFPDGLFSAEARGLISKVRAREKKASDFFW